MAIRAADAAGEVIRRSYGGAIERFAKGGGDFATAVDLAAERDPATHEELLTLVRRGS